MAYRRGFKSEASDIAAEVRAELGLSLYERLFPHALAESLEIPIIRRLIPPRVRRRRPPPRRRTRGLPGRDRLFGHTPHDRPQRRPLLRPTGQRPHPRALRRSIAPSADASTRQHRLPSVEPGHRGRGQLARRRPADPRSRRHADSQRPLVGRPRGGPALRRQPAHGAIPRQRHGRPPTSSESKGALNSSTETVALPRLGPAVRSTVSISVRGAMGGAMLLRERIAESGGATVARPSSEPRSSPQVLYASLAAQPWRESRTWEQPQTAPHPGASHEPVQLWMTGDSVRLRSHAERTRLRRRGVRIRTVR